MADALREICEFIAGIDLANIPQAVGERAKYCILDNLGCAVLGADDESGIILGKVKAPLGFGNDAAIVRQKDRTSAFVASMINASYIHATDLSEGVARGTVHPGTVIIPAALAEAELLHASGTELMLSVVVGYEMLIRLGWALSHNPSDPIDLCDPQLLMKGWFPPSMIGSFGAAIAAGKLRHLNAEQLYSSLCICANLLPTCSGAAASEGAMVKALGSGWASALGLYAAHLAEAGFTGLDNIFDSVLSKFTSAIDPSFLTRDLGKRFELEELGMKWIAAGPLRSELESVFEIMKMQPMNAADIADIEVITNQRTAFLMNETAPVNLLACRFSAPYAMAQALVGMPREQFLDEVFTETAYANPDWRPVAKLIRFIPKDEYTKSFETYPNTARPCQVTIRTKDGKSVTHGVTYVHGNKPNSPPPPSDYITKFRKVVDRRLSESSAERIVAQIKQLESLPDTRLLMDSLC